MKQWVVQSAKITRASSLDPDIVEFVSLVDKESLGAYISRMVKFGTRWSYSSNVSLVPEWIHKKFVTMGYRENIQVRYQDFDIPGSEQRAT